MSNQDLAADAGSTLGVLGGVETQPNLEPNGLSEENARTPVTGSMGLLPKAPATARVPFVNLFKENRMANENHNLTYYPSGTNTLSFSFEDIDTIETAYGICLLGFVISGRPPTKALIDLVRRWGKDVHFQTHESGWIIFTFPSLEARAKVLNGGTYLVYGYHLFLKEMPRCFKFKEEDMNTLPAWVQIHGLPPDCWNHYVLSNIASEIGCPIHMDLLTHGRKRVKYARVLVEMDAAVARIHDLEVILPTGKTTINFCL